MKLLVTLFSLFTLLSCASPKYIEKEVPIETVRVEYIDKIKIDSIYIHDSISSYVNNDTIYKYKYKYVYKFINRIDTILRIDSIEVPIKITEIKEVNKVNSLQKVCIFIGCIAIVAVVWKISRMI